MNLNAQTRTYIYLVAVAILPILVAYGLLSADTAPLWLALAAAVLAVGPNVLALRNVTPDDEPPPVDVPDPEA